MRSQFRGVWAQAKAEACSRVIELACMRSSPRARAARSATRMYTSSRERGRASNMPACIISSSHPVACPSVRVLKML